MTKSTPQVSTPHWRGCNPGELAALAQGHRQQIQRRHFLRGFVVAASGSALAGAVGFALWPRPDTNLAADDLACDAVVPLLPRYLAHQLTAESAAQVKKHLANCPHCSERLKQLKPATTS